MLNPVFVALIALLPAALTWWWGRRLARLADDPVLPERLLAARTRKSVITSAGIMLLFATAQRHLIWALPLLVVTRMSAAYPLRKTLHRETWSLPTYLSFFSRLGVAAFGFWILLIETPWIASLAGSRDWMVAAGLAVVLLIWSEGHGAIFRMMLRARPIDDPSIVSRFEAMVKACALPAVALEQVELRGGAFTNAVALPSTRQSAVVASSTLVERLERDETIAILGHELAHIEHYHPRRLRRMRAMTYALIAASTLLAPVIRLTAPPALTAAMLTWQVCLVAVMALQARQRQQHETASDLRAIALAGDPDALVRALIKIHAFNQMPRRWDAEWERHATHPSLARRIQAIHAAAGTAPVALSAPVTFVGADDVASVIFHGDRLSWNDGPGASHTIDYQQLTMLRVAAKAAGAPRLVAVDAAHRTWEMRLRPCDLVRAQATLDIVDTRLAAATAPPVISFALSRTLALIALLMALSVAQFATALLGFIVLAQPAGPLAAAAGAASIGTAALMLRDYPLWTIDWRPWMALSLLVCGAGLIAATIVNRRERVPPITTRLLGALAAVTIAVWTAIALTGMSTLDLHRGARAWPSATVLALALGAALASLRSRAARYASAPVLAAGFLAAFVGSTTFLDRFGRDPFLGSSGAVTVNTIGASALRTEFHVPFEVTELSLSPAGRFVVIASEDDDEDTTIHAGPIGGPFATFQADEALFADEGRVLLLERQRGASVLRVIDLGRGGREVWSQRVSAGTERLSLDRASKTWQLLGWNEDHEIVSVSGRLGDGGIVREQRWTEPASDDAYMRSLTVSHGYLLTLETSNPPGAAAKSPLARLASLVESERHAESRFWSIDDSGASAFATSHLDLRCRSHQLDDAPTTCTAFDGTRTGFFAVDPATRRTTALASVGGQFFLHGDAHGGWLLGRWQYAPILLQPVSRTALRVSEPDREVPDLLAREGTIVGAVWSSGSESTVRLYSME